MRHILSSIFLVLSSSLIFAQAKDWKQMQDFHEIISRTFHPAEEGNFKPLKGNADSLVSYAILWQASAIPKGYSSQLVKPNLTKLVAECQAVKLAVTQKKDDGTLKKLITAVHSTFHEIMEKGEK